MKARVVAAVVNAADKRFKISFSENFRRGHFFPDVFFTSMFSRHISEKKKIFHLLVRHAFSTNRLFHILWLFRTIPAKSQCSLGLFTSSQPFVTWGTSVNDARVSSRRKTLLNAARPVYRHYTLLSVAFLTGTCQSERGRYSMRGNKARGWVVL